MPVQRNNRQNDVLDQRSMTIIIIGVLLAMRMFVGQENDAEPFKKEIEREEGQIEEQYKIIQRYCQQNSVDYD